jgi:rhamnose transport system substrate-binding protein
MFRSPLRRSAPIALGLAVILGLAACGGTTKNSTQPSTAAATGAATSAAASADPNAPLKTGLKIAFLPKQLNNPYNTVETDGGKGAVQKLGGVFQVVGPTDTGASSQVSYINTLIQQKQDVIAIAANDPNAVCPALNQARAAGIKVVTLDSDAAATCRDVFVNQATVQAVADSLVKMTKDSIGESGEIAILSATANATNQNSWIAAFKENLKKPENAGLKLVTTVYGDDNDQKSFTQTQSVLRNYPKLKAIVAPTSVGINSAARYISSTKAYKGKVAVTGLCLPSGARKALKDGSIKECSLWNVTSLGALAAYAGAALASGQITGAEGESFTAGDLGKFTIVSGHEVDLGPLTVYTAANVDQFHF